MEIRKSQKSQIQTQIPEILKSQIQTQIPEIPESSVLPIPVTLNPRELSNPPIILHPKFRLK